MFESAMESLAENAGSIGTSPADLGDAEMLSAVDELVRIGRRVDALASALLAEADVRGSSDVLFGHRTAAWVSHSTREARRSAHQRLKAGRGCRRLPFVATAWSDGRVSIDHVTVLSRAVANPRVADHIVALQELLVERAQEITFEAWRNEVLGIVETLDVDGSFRPDDPDAPSVLHLLPLFDGSVQLHAELSPADHAVVVKALNDEADTLFRNYTRDCDESRGEVEVPPRAQLMAEALVSLCRKGMAVDLESTAPARPEVVIVINEDTPGVAAVNDADVAVPTVRLGGLLSDADWRHIVLDPKGEVLHLGRTRRLANRAQRRALSVRDGGCVFPGCDAPVSWCEAHHLLPWEEGGETDVGQMVLLCRRHHGVVHRNGWTWALDTDDGRVRWTTPGGTVLVSQRHRQPPGARPVVVDLASGRDGLRRWYAPGADPNHAAPLQNAPPRSGVAG